LSLRNSMIAPEVGHRKGFDEANYGWIEWWQ
jgi:hypothetical protein